MKSINHVNDFIDVDVNNNNDNHTFISIDDYNVNEQSRKNMNHNHDVDDHDDDNNIVGVHDDAHNSYSIKHNQTLNNHNISCIKLSVTEGKYRMVRRILHNCGYSVLYLHRLSYGSIILDENVINEGKVGHVHIDQQQILINEYQRNNKKNKKKI